MTDLAVGRHTIPLAAGGRGRPFTLQVPTGVSTAAVPLVLELHGRGIDPIAFDRWTGFAALGDEMGFVLAMPSAIREIWNDGRVGGTPDRTVDDVGYLASVIDDVCRRLPIDQRRIYVVVCLVAPAGHSMPPGSSGTSSRRTPGRVSKATSTVPGPGKYLW